MNESENSLVTELGICFIWDIKGERAIKKEDSLFLGNYKTQESKHKITSGKEDDEYYNEYMEMQRVKEKNSVKFMRKIWAVNTDLGIINNMPYTSEAREQMR